MTLELIDDHLLGILVDALLTSEEHLKLISHYDFLDL